MNNVWLLLKINLLNLFNINKIRHATNGKEKQKDILILGALVIAFISIGSYFYTFANLSMQGYMALNIPHILLVQSMVTVSLFILVTTLYKSNAILFNYKDYDFNMSLPIKTKDVIISRLLLIYIYNLFISLIVLIPNLLVYIKYVNPPFIFYILYLISFLVIGLIPTILSTIIGSVIAYFSSFFKKRNIVNIILSLVIVFGFMYFNSTMGTYTVEQFTDIGVKMVDMFNRIYPLTKVYNNIIENNSLISLMLFILISIGLSTIFVYVLHKNYSHLNSFLSGTKTKNNYKVKITFNSSSKSLYKRELKRYFSSSIYVLNTIIGPILLIIGSIYISLKGVENLLALMNFDASLDILSKLPFAVAVVLALSSTTSSSISLEGNNLWIIKSLPVKARDVFKSKILVNLTILIPGVIISSTILSIFLKLNAERIILLFMISIIYAFLTSFIGLLINAYFPKFDYTNDTQVVKQSLAVLLTMLACAAISIIPIVININIYIIIAILIIILIVLRYIVYNKLDKIYNNYTV